jgi:outer membrane immunogenic protein
MWERAPRRLVVPKVLKETTMHKLLLASAALALAGPAVAADLPRAPEPLAPSAAIAPGAFSWTGFYVGLNAGYGFSGSFSNDANLGLGSGDGFTGGLQAGYNYQFNQFDPLVVGIEGEVDYANIFASAGDARGDLNWRASITPRIGYAFDRLMPYVKGGAAFGDVKIDTGFGSDTNVLWGWTAGLGVEYAFTDNLSVRAEYNYTDLGRDTFTDNLGSLRAGYKGSDVKVGVNYRF